MGLTSPPGRSTGLLLLPLVLTACGEPSAPELAGPLDTLRIDGGSRSGHTGRPLDGRPSVIALDAAHRPVPGSEVRFEVVRGGGEVAEPTRVTSDREGRATAGTWTLGPALGEQILDAIAADASGGTVRTSFRVTAEWYHEDAAPSLINQEIGGFHLHPDDERRWYATSIQSGLYLSGDGGATWRAPILDVGINRHGLRVDPVNTDTVFVGVQNQLLVSGDRGETWALRHAFDPYLWIRSILVRRDGSLLVAPQWPPGSTPGVFRSEDRGSTWTHHPYGVGQDEQILTWILYEDPATGRIWSGNEIADHPEPYQPPFLVSEDGGRTWDDVTDRLPFVFGPWHVIDMAAAHGRLYALSEGAGFFRSTDGGETWERLGRSFSLSVLPDPEVPGRLFGGDFAEPYGEGELLVSFDGASFLPAVTSGYHVTQIALMPGSRNLLFATWGGGIRAVEIPENAR